MYLFDWVFPSFEWEMCSSISSRIVFEFLFSVYFSYHLLLRPGANPIHTLALTTFPMDFTYVGVIMCRGMDIKSSLRPNLLSSFEWNWTRICGHVAESQEEFGARSNEVEICAKWTSSNAESIIFRPQKIVAKRARNIDFNDIRTKTTSGRYNAIYDNCNSLHTKCLWWRPITHSNWGCQFVVQWPFNWLSTRN